MNLEQHHYGEEVNEITLDGVQPYGNSYQFELFHLDNKKIRKAMRNHSPDVKTFMNVVFTYRQTQWKVGDELNWCLKGVNFKVILLDSHLLSVKGKQFYQYVIGVKP
ncbi:hypothetical protein ACFIPR_003188 [Enterobacter kobei]